MFPDKFIQLRNIIRMNKVEEIPGINLCWKSPQTYVGIFLSVYIMCHRWYISHSFPTQKAD